MADSLKKGSLIRVNRQAYLSSVEAKASAGDPPAYLLEGPGEVLAVKGDYAQLRFLSGVQDAVMELERYTAGYVDDYLRDGREMIREACLRRQRIQAQLPV